MELRYVLRLIVPDTIAPDVLAEIEAEAEFHDSALEDKIRRYVGGIMVEGEGAVRDELPEGWDARLEDA